MLLRTHCRFLFFRFEWSASGKWLGHCLDFRFFFINFILFYWQFFFFNSFCLFKFLKCYVTCFDWSAAEKGSQVVCSGFLFIFKKKKKIYYQLKIFNVRIFLHPYKTLVLERIFSTVQAPKSKYPTVIFLEMYVLRI